MALPRVIDSREKRLAPEKGAGKFSFQNIPTWVWYAAGAIIVIVVFLMLTKGSSGTPLTVPGATGTVGGAGAGIGATVGTSDLGSGILPSTGGSTSSGFVTSSSVDNGIASSGNTTSPIISASGGSSTGPTNIIDTVTGAVIGAVTGVTSPIAGAAAIGGIAAASQPTGAVGDIPVPTTSSGNRQVVKAGSKPS